MSFPARVAGVLILGYLVLVMVNAASVGNLHTGDTDVLVQGARQALQCLGRGKLVGCGHASGSPLTAVAPYPLLQYLPAMALLKLGLSNNQVIHALGSVNLAALAATLIVVAVRWRRWVWAPVLVLALLGSSLTYQSTSGFGEMLAAFFGLLALSAVLWRRSALIVVAMALATTGKETLFPFLLLLGLLAGRREEDGPLPPRRVCIPIVAGIVLGEILNLGFNEFRFGTYKNLTYLEPIFRTPGLERKANFLAALWAAPSAGALWYWTLAVVLVAGVAVTTLVRLARHPREVSVWLPPVLAVGTLIAFTAGLTDWYTPFGWIAYGPRLLVPLFPGALLVILYTGGPLLIVPLRRLLLRVPGTVLVAAIVVIGGWAQFGAPWSWLPAVLRLNTATGGCPALTQVIIQKGEGLYYHCTQIVMWRIHPIVLKAAAVDGGGYALAGRVLLSLASLLLVADLVGRVRRSSSEPTEGHELGV
jgi:hypothetical protein